MIYSIRLTIAHRYDQPAANGRHLIRVLPRSVPGRQRLMTNLIEISPDPETRADALDFFGNAMTACAHTDQHAEMSIRLSCHVEMTDPAPLQDVYCPNALLRAQSDALTDLGPQSPLHYPGPKGRWAPDAEASRFSQEPVAPNDTTATNVIRHGEAQDEALIFDTEGTTVDDAGVAAFRRLRACA